MHFKAESKRFIRAAITSLSDFQRSNLSAQAYANWSEVDKGRLESDDYEISYDDMIRKVYVIKSYQTPIAWCFVDDDGTRRWTIVERKFTPTTGRHKALIHEIVG